MRKRNSIAILCSDLHLSMLMPSCRANRNWLKVQAHYLKQLGDSAGGLPVLCAGDIFDRWNPPPELINFALDNLPTGMMCVPGQHDLPNHVMAQKHRSGYGVLAKAGKIEDLTEHEWVIPKGLKFVAYGFGWEQEITKPTNPSTGIPHVAVIHRYCWMGPHKFSDAPPTANITAYKRVLSGYSAAVFGDNHKGFLAQVGDCAVLNCGGFMRRKSDEMDYQPSIGVLYDDGSIVRRPLDTAIDRFIEGAETKEESAFDMSSFVKGLESLGSCGLDFREAVDNHLKGQDLHPDTKNAILKALEL